MKIILKTPEGRKTIESARSQITDKVSLKQFDEFIAKNDVFDFNNDQHLEALKKPVVHSNCTIDW